AQNDAFWSLAPFFAGVPDFAAYAERVAYSPRRLYAMLMRAEIEADAGLAPDLKAAAARVADLFDPLFYLAEYPDVALAGSNPLLHYLTDGAREGRRPHPFFDPEYYCAQKPAAAGNPLLDYAEAGSAQGLKPHPLFDPAFYRARNPDIAEGGVEPLHHYEVWGGREGRDPSPIFDTGYYLARRGAGFSGDNPLLDYLAEGWIAGHDPHPLFSARHFAATAGIAEFAEAPLAVYRKRPDLWEAKPHPLFDPAYFTAELARLGLEPREDRSPLEYFCAFGPEADLSPHRLFDAPLYRYQVERELGRSLEEPALLDYLKRGWHDKTLLPNPLFDPQTYVARNRIEPEQPELVHYVTAGDRAGYWCHEMFCAGVYNAQRANGGPATALEHFFAAPDEELLRSHPHLRRPLGRRLLEWLRAAVAVAADVDPDFYRASYPDLGMLNDAQVATHYREYGRLEGRFGTPRELLVAKGMRLRDVPLGFFADEYLTFNPDLAVLGESFPVLFCHYLQQGRAENRKIGRWQFHLNLMPPLDLPTREAPLALDHAAEKAEVCVLMHIFYPDLWPELASFAKNFEAVSRDVFINLVDEAWSPGLHREIREMCPDAFVQLSNDNGRDIGGFVRLLDNVDFGKYRLFALVHSKKSPHIPEEQATHWRRALLSAFAGSRETVQQCVAMFRDDPTVGLVGAAQYRETTLGDNAAVFEALLDRFEISPGNRGTEYLSGTMFLIRGEILERLYDRLKQSEWEYGGDISVEEHMDGQLAHGVERVVGNLVKEMGYRIVWRPAAEGGA
ncbi:MAG TPA: rhamnan synthesis F family protein, partial [Stellaceae bacterium]|nr:rhamnan synthesis F family protein [Stellaceae bacterium]